MIEFEVLEKPVSVNSCYSNGKNGRRFMTATGKAFKEAVAYATTHGMRVGGWEDCDPDGKYIVTITYFFPSNRNDIDGSNKLVLDAMQGIVYNNDSQVVELHCYKNKDKDNPRIRIKLEVL